jgi:hypothetical protein
MDRRGKLDTVAGAEFVDFCNAEAVRFSLEFEGLPERAASPGSRRWLSKIKLRADRGLPWLETPHLEESHIGFQRGGP